MQDLQSEFRRENRGTGQADQLSTAREDLGRRGMKLQNRSFVLQNGERHPGAIIRHKPR